MIENSHFSWSNRWFDEFSVIDEKLVYSSPDGTDMSIFDPKPFARSEFLMNLNKNSLRYEINASMKSYSIFWDSGIFPRGILLTWQFFGQIAQSDTSWRSYLYKFRNLGEN